MQLHIDPNIAERLKLGEEPNDVHVLRRFYCEGNNLDIKYSVYVTRTPDDQSSLVPLGTGEIRQILMWDLKAVSVDYEKWDWRAWVNRNVEEVSRTTKQTSLCHVSKKRKLGVADVVDRTESSPDRITFGEPADTSNGRSSAEKNISLQCDDVEDSDHSNIDSSTGAPRAVETNMEKTMEPKDQQERDAIKVDPKEDVRSVFGMELCCPLIRKGSSGE